MRVPQTSFAALRRWVLVGILAAIATELIYGVSFVFTKAAVGLISPAALLAWRFVAALVVLLVLMATRLVRVRLPRSSWPSLAALAVCQPLLYYAAETLGVQRTTASEASIVLAMTPVAILLASWLILRKPPSHRQVAGILITLVGVLLTVVAGGVQAGADVVGYLLLVGAVASYALYAVFAERDQVTSGLDKTFAMVLAGAVVFPIIALAEAAGRGQVAELLRVPLTHPEVLVGIGYLAIAASVGAFFLQAVAIGRIGSARYSTFIGLSTIAALSVAAIALGERLLPLQLLGGAIILVGVYVANRSDR